MGGRRARMVGIAVVAACAVIAAVLVLVLDVGGGGGGGGGGGHAGNGGGRTANLWVSRTAGSCAVARPGALRRGDRVLVPRSLPISEGGDRVLIRDGAYKVSRSPTRSNAPGVTFRAENPGRASTAGPISVTGTWITFEDLVIHGAATLGPGAANITFLQDRITGEASAYGVAANPPGPGSWIESEISNRGAKTSTTSRAAGSTAAGSPTATT